MSARKPKPAPTDLFRRPDGQPYDFWIQDDLESSLRQSIVELVKNHGGRVTKFGEFPEYGFLLIDPTQTHPLYAIKSTFHKPVDIPMRFRRNNAAVATPLRHVLSYSFVQDAVTRGHWNHRDLRRWGWPLTLPPIIKGSEAANIAQYTREIRQGIDDRLERGWIWATGRTFDRFDPLDKFPKEFEELEERLKADAPKDIVRIRNRERGEILARLKHEQQVGFFLHESIPRERQNELVNIIMRNGGRTCHDQGNADILLIDCTVSDMQKEERLRDLANDLHRTKQAGKAYSPLIHAGWIDACIKAGDWRAVGIQEYDMMGGYIRAKRQNRFGTTDSATDRASSVGGANESTWRMDRSSRLQRIPEDTNTSDRTLAGRPKRKRPEEDEAEGDVAKKQKIHEWSTRVPGSFNKGSPIPPAEPGDASTIKAKRILTGVSVPSFASSPLKHQQPASLLTYHQNPDQRKAPVTESSPGTASEANRSSIAEKENVEKPTERAPRVSAASGITIATNDTGTASKVLNTTIETTTTMSKSARSVGPAPPPNAKQIPRPSTSTAISNFSGASRGVVDEHPVHATESQPADVESDDAAAEEILDLFDPLAVNQPVIVSETSLPAYDKDKPFVLMKVTQFEKDLVLYLRGLHEYDAEEELEHLTRLVEGWPAIAKEKEEERRAIRRRKGKGRVSFHSSVTTKDISPVATTQGEIESERAREPEEVDELIDEEEEEPPLQVVPKRAALRLNHSSVTPESHRSTETEDEEFQPSTQDDEENVGTGGGEREDGQERASSRTPRAPVPASTRVTRSHATVASIDMLPEASPAAFKTHPPEPIPESTQQTAPMGNASNQNTEGANNDQNGDRDEGDELEEEVESTAPLPELPTRRLRATQKRSASIASDRASVNEQFKPRRGRSASVAPATPVGSQTRRKGGQVAKVNVAKRGRRK
ncbi:SubName: Full=Uncharacterized protein {ECO:0000313/EMBL:CCA69044.1} [Serendipita indica DSM 11827]|nr:SubName: Full=Uncharacterized protein {ECO:0000313/EMBL:CCA69044.1} [Serendipita indica DSM 11827]